MEIRDLEAFGLEREFAGTPTVFTGFLHGEELAAAYASSDVFLFPSTTDTLGLAMVEALASGLPVVAARSGAASEVVDDGTTGVLYEAVSAASLVGSVWRLVADPGLRGRMGREARAAAERKDLGASARTLRRHYVAARRARLRRSSRAAPQAPSRLAGALPAGRDGVAGVRGHPALPCRFRRQPRPR